MKNFIKIISALLVVCLFYSCDFLRAGSYPFSEIYEIDCNDEELRMCIKKMKMQDTTYNVFIKKEDGLMHNMDERSENFDCYYFKDKNNKVFFVVIHNAPQKQAILRLVGYSDSVLNLYFKRINTDEFTKEENKLIKNLFEEEILNKLGVDWCKKNILN